MAVIAKNIFRGNDVRGLDGTELNEEVYYLLGISYGALLRKSSVDSCVVGYDGRKNSQQYASSLIKGLQDAGITVIDVGMVTTPMVYWAQARYSVQGSAVITASHNPAEWNGAKFSFDFSDDSNERNLERMYDSITGKEYEKNDGGVVKREDIRDAYFDDIANRVSIKKKIKFLVNTGHGVVGSFAPDLLKRIGVDVIAMNREVDFARARYVPDPLNAEMIHDTARAVSTETCDGAFMFDGDGDRVGLVDENGSVVPPDIFSIVLVRSLYGQKKDLKVVYDIMSTQAISDECEKLGVESFCSKTGYTYLKKKMLEVGADVGFEASGHVIFVYNYYGFDDGLYAATQLARYFAEREESVSRIIQSIPQYISGKAQYIKVEEERKADVIERLKQEFIDEGYEVDSLDGIRFTVSLGWGIIRASQTSPAIAVRVEAKTLEAMREIKNLIDKKLQAVLEE